jgi:hypothetical protein
MQAFLNAVYDAIKAVDAKHPVMASGLARPWELPLLVGSVQSDLFGAHYNDDGSMAEEIQTVDEIAAELMHNYGLRLDRPLVMTEGPDSIGVAGATRTKHLDAYLTAAFRGGWAGYLPWTYQGLITGGTPYYIRFPDAVLTSKNSCDLQYQYCMTPSGCSVGEKCPPASTGASKFCADRRAACVAVRSENWAFFRQFAETNADAISRGADYSPAVAPRTRN